MFNENGRLLLSTAQKQQEFLFTHIAKFQQLDTAKAWRHHCDSVNTHARNLTIPSMLSATKPNLAQPRHTSSKSSRTYMTSRKSRGECIPNKATHLLFHFRECVGGTRAGSRRRCITACTISRFPSESVLSPDTKQRDNEQSAEEKTTSMQRIREYLAVVRMSSTHVAHSPTAISHTSLSQSYCSMWVKPDVCASSMNLCSICCWISTYAEAAVGYGRLQVT